MLVQIKRLRLTGFKSFVEPSELRIEPGLTGVVGPNGCGKSNLLEAIRWVMGESSPKSMRGGGMDDVIFAGTSTRPARDFAEVTLHCDSEGALVPGLSEPADGDDLEIIRRIDRGAGSAYRANGRDVRAKDIALIFADAATGAHSPALVSQGKIANIIAARPTERRAMLEEAAGIAGLHVRRKDAEQKLRATESNLQRLSEILADMDVRAAALRKQARTAERYRQISADIRTAEARSIFARWRDAQNAATRAQQKANAADAAVQETQTAVDELESHYKSGAAALAKQRQATQNSRDAFAEISAQWTRIESEKRGVEARLSDLTKQQQQLAGDRDREGELGKTAHRALTDLEAEAKSLTSHIGIATRARGHLAQADQRAHRNLRDSEIALAQARATAASEAADRRIAIAARDAAAHAQQKSESLSQRIKSERDALGSSSTLLSALQEAENSARESSAHIAAVETALDTAQAELETATAELQICNQKAAETHSEWSSLQSEITTLKRALAANANDSGTNALIDSIIVANGYEAAVAAALGDDLSAGTDSREARFWDNDLASGKPVETRANRLTDHVQAPAFLAHRLAHVVILPHDDGRPLAVGERLVTLDGQMRRWDGFRTQGDGALASQRLIQRNRLRERNGALPLAEADYGVADAARSAAVLALTAVQNRAQAARAALAEADQSRRSALLRADQAQSQLERHESAAALLDQRWGEADALYAEAKADLICQEAVLSKLPDDGHSSAQLALVEASNISARQIARQSRESLAAHDREDVAARQRLAVVHAEAKSWKSRAGEAAKRVADMDKRAQSLSANIAMLAGLPAKFDREIAMAEEKRSALKAGLRDSEQAETSAEQEQQAMELALQHLRDQSAAAREARAGALARNESAEHHRSEMARLSGERFGCPPVLLPPRVEFDDDTVRSVEQEATAHDRLAADRDKLGPVNLVAADELAILDAEQQRSSAEIDELQQAVNRLRGSIGSLNREGRTRLLAAFEAVNGHFQRLFHSLFGGGMAHLELVDSDDPLEAGLEIMAQPPGKKLGTLTLLSGGEQALTAVALIFGLFLTNPAPICVLDEVDAPLDDANIERFCNLLDQMVRETRTRYLIVTHNAVTMARMHRLYGVTMVERGISRLVSVNLGSAEQLLAAE